jgi:ornithine cyclodeaminase
MTGPVWLRYLGRADVIAAGGDDMAAAISDVRAALVLLRAGAAEMPAETSVRLGGPAERTARAYALPARVGAAAGVKWTAHRPRPLAPGLAAPSLTLVNDAISGVPVGLVESALLTPMRTAAVSALVLANAGPDIRRLTLLGAGAQAETHLRMLIAECPELSSVTVWNRDPARAIAMLHKARRHTPWPLRTTDHLADALDDADAVISCTSATTPFLGAELMRPGRLVLQIGHHEVTFDAIDRADTVIVDQWGQFARTSTKSLFQMHRAGRFPAERVSADLAQLVLDGWRPQPRATIYFSSFGLNIFDIALADRVLRNATAANLGTLLEMPGH